MPRICELLQSLIENVKVAFESLSILSDKICLINCKIEGNHTILAKLEFLPIILNTRCLDTIFEVKPI